MSLKDLFKRLSDLDSDVIKLHQTHNQKAHGRRRATSGEQWVQGLSMQEWGAISDWSTVNANSIREGIASNKKNDTVENFDSALAKSPVFEGTVYRGMAFKTEKERDKWVNDTGNGLGFTEKSASSFSKSRKIAEEFANERRDEPLVPTRSSVIMIVKMKNGNDISSFDRLTKQEQEVVSYKGSSYRLERIDRPQGRPVEMTFSEISSGDLL